MGIFQRNSTSTGSEKKKVTREPSGSQLGIPLLNNEFKKETNHNKEQKLAKPDTSRYGIDEVMALMHKLPEGDLDTVVTVVKHTLESLDVEVAHIIEDADDKMQTISRQLETLNSEILQFQENIKTRQAQIAVLEAELKNTEQVKQDLLHAEKLNGTSLKNTTVDNPGVDESTLETTHDSGTANAIGVGFDEYDDGIPVVEAIDLDNHNLGESFRESIRKTKSKLPKQAVTS